MEYKGYFGKVEYDEEAEVLHGEVINIKDVVTFEGTNINEIKQAFRDSVDDYLDFCAERNEEPEKPYSGKFVVRTDPDLHKGIAVMAKKQGKSINALVNEILITVLDDKENDNAITAGRLVVKEKDSLLVRENMEDEE